jgi:hypothetical protein
MGTHMRRVAARGLLLLLVALGGPSLAFDHEDGQPEGLASALNLADHFVFKSGSELSLVMTFNPRAVATKPYFMSTRARYEFHLARVATKTSPAVTAPELTFRFEAGEANADGVQPLVLTVLKNGVVAGTHSGFSTSFAGSKDGKVTTNVGTAGGVGLKYFVGMRSDTSHVDFTRFAQVRSFYRARFFGGTGGAGNPQASLPPNCRGDGLLQEGAGADADAVNLWNPPSCAPDFNKNHNVTTIVLNVPLADLQGTVFDSWSSISVRK